MAKGRLRRDHFRSPSQSRRVLSYGIPEFRLPKDKVVAAEVRNVEGLGVKILTDTIVGKTVLLDELLDEEGFEAAFIASEQAFPCFMGIPENANGVFRQMNT